MTDLRKAAELALEALEDVFDLKNKDVEAIQALRQALAQTEKPPVKSYCGGKPNYCTPVDETAKCKREWVGLTEEEMEDLLITIPWPQVCNAIEAKLKEKNT